MIFFFFLLWLQASFECPLFFLSPLPLGIGILIRTVAPTNPLFSLLFYGTCKDAFFLFLFYECEGRN